MQGETFSRKSFPLHPFQKALTKKEKINLLDYKRVVCRGWSTAVRSRRCSDNALRCHSLPRRRFATSRASRKINELSCTKNQPVGECLGAPENG